MIDNIIVGKPVEGLTLDDLGIGQEETTVQLDPRSQDCIETRLFLPALLVHVGLFKTTSEIKRINKDRQNSKKITDPLSRNLWRTLDEPEMTFFKIGKRVFTLIVGDLEPHE